MKQLLDLMQDIKDNGISTDDRTGVGRRKVFGRMLHFSMAGNKIPVPTTRKIYLRGIIEELLMFIRGESNIKVLQDKNVKIWNEWAVTREHVELFVDKHMRGETEGREGIIRHYLDKYEGSIGKIYGEAWRHAPAGEISALDLQTPVDEIASDKLRGFQEQYDIDQPKNQDGSAIPFELYASYMNNQEIDQLQKVLANLKKVPYSSRHVVTCWIPSYIPDEAFSPQENVLLGKGALAACPTMFQFLVFPPAKEGGKKRISLMLTIRSNDIPKGAPYNYPQFAILLAMVAQVSDMERMELIVSLGDAHIYLDQLPLIDEQLSRTPLPPPTLWLNPEVTDLFAFTADDIRIEDYQHHPVINYPIAT